MITVHWLLGLPFDALSLEDAKSRIYAAVEDRRQLVFATPNVNFLALAHRDPRFREDVLRTDLSLADGRPIVWLGRLLGIPFVERVAGSDLIESLITEPGPRPLKVYFFGGEEGAAAAASAALNRRRGGLIGAGSCYPGFVDLDQMDGADVIDDINRSEADLLVVSLGAAKGHRWIEANRHRLTVPVISHLGAVVNFVAGRMRRAPRFMQRTGLEWLWRILEEPKLVTRYARDAGYLMGAMFREVLPRLLERLLPSPESRLRKAVAADGKVSVTVETRLGVSEVTELDKMGVAEVALRNVRHLDPAGAGWVYARYFRSAGEEPRVDCDSASSATLAKWSVTPRMQMGACRW
jgi:N-acetylglucosaminyldiphosphoundecaprenol N-acetyl-beta-D-mannosaminyltransferase